MHPALPFEQKRLDREAAAAFEAAKAALRQKLATRVARARRKKQEKIEKNVRKWRRDNAYKARHDKDRLWATCGIHLYNGGSWTHCVKCRQPLTYSDFDTAHLNRRECVPPAPAPFESGQN